MGIDYRHAVLATDPRVWDTLSRHERVTVLQTLEDHTADWSGRLPRTVTVQFIPSEQGNHNFGYYDHYHDPDKLFLNEQDLDDVNETLDTLFHEGQHAYQHDCVDGKVSIPEPIRQQFDDAFTNYVPQEQDPRAYFNNFAEKDAREEAQRALMRLENDRAIFQKNDHNIETASDMSEMTPEPSELSENVVSESVEHEKSGPTIPWSDEEDTQPVKVKTLGGRDMVTHVSSDADMSNEEKMQLCRDRLHTDLNAYSENRNYIESEDRDPLRNDVEKELYSYYGLEACHSNGNAEGFDVMYDRFLEDSSCFRQNYENCYYNGMKLNNEGIASKSKVVEDNNQHPDTHKDTKSLTKDEQDSLRQKAVNGAWKREKEYVQNGQGTRDWTVEQQAEMLKEGRVTGFEGSHMMSVKDYPEYAGNPDNIQFLPSVAHFEGVHQGNSTKVHPNGRFDENTGEVIPAEDGQIPEQPVIELSDKYDPLQEEYHRSTPEMEQSGQKRHDDYYRSKKNHPEKSQKIGFRAPPEEEHNEEIAYKNPEDQTESAQAEKTPEESSTIQDKENNEEIAQKNTEDQTESAQAEKTPEESSTNQEEKSNEEISQNNPEDQTESTRAEKTPEEASTDQEEKSNEEITQNNLEDQTESVQTEKTPEESSTTQEKENNEEFANHNPEDQKESAQAEKTPEEATTNQEEKNNKEIANHNPEDQKESAQAEKTPEEATTNQEEKNNKEIANQNPEDQTESTQAEKKPEESSTTQEKENNEEIAHNNPEDQTESTQAEKKPEESSTTQEKENNEEIAHNNPEDRTENTQAEKTSEETSTNQEEAAETKVSTETQQNAPKQEENQDNQISEHTDDVSVADRESEKESNSYAPTDNSPRASNDQDNQTSKQAAEAPETPSEQALNESGQNDDHSNFWSNVPSNTESSDSESNNQENNESNSASSDSQSNDHENNESNSVSM